MAQRKAQKSGRCQHPSLAVEANGSSAAISLPVLADHSAHNGGQIRKSRSGKRRAIVLAIVQLLMLAHIAFWLLSKKYGWLGGETLSPVEPSESMEFTKNGVINAGLIFFSVALLSTLVLGRWFCGWGCHIVMLQDFCGWIMKKCGVRPKPFRSRLLIYVPLILAIYMFIWPMVHRLAIIPADARLAESLGDSAALVQGIRTVSWWLGFPISGHAPPEWRAEWHVTTTDFWKTFPSGLSAIIVIPLFLFICGFAVVYFLGAKGFCTYGCPYGGFFAPLDKFAPGRILVTDACEHCGHCTAVCTSNVRVHEEVREFGMVVDPGCMKCLDCVSVCPNDALYFGFAKPAVMKPSPKNSAPKRIFDMTLGEEFAFAGIFLLSFLALRGVYGMVPMLMAGGTAGIITFLSWKLWRMIRDPNVNLYKFQFKLRGVVKPAGWTFSGIMMLIFALTIHSGIVNAALKNAQWHDAKVLVSQDAIFSPTPPTMSAEMTAHADRALTLLNRASFIRDGGIGLAWAWQGEIDMMRARLHASKLEFAAAETVLRRAIERDGPSDRYVSSLMWVMNSQGKTAEAVSVGSAAALEHGLAETADAVVQLSARQNEIAPAEQFLQGFIKAHGPSDRLAGRLMFLMHHLGRTGEALNFGRELLLNNREYPTVLEAYVNLAGMIGDTQMILDLCKQRDAKFPDDLRTLQWWAVVLHRQGAYEQALALHDRTLAIMPRNHSGYFAKAMTLTEMDRMEEAAQSVAKALEIMPDNLQYNLAMSDLLNALGRTEEAAKYMQKAEALQQKMQPGR